MEETNNKEIAPSLAVVNVEPESDKVFQGFVDEVNGLLNISKTITISSKEDVEAATNDLSLLANLKKAIEAKRQEYVGPINEHVKAINTTFKAITDPLAEADQTYRNKVKAYYAEEDRKRREAEEIARLKAEAAAREAALNNQPPPAPAPEIKVYEPSKNVNAQVGASTMMMVKKWEVIDENLIPRMYLIIDAAKITKQVKAGIGSIPGIRIYEEPTLRIEAKK